MATIEGSSSSTFPVFVDTNFETHLLILVSSDDTVDDLKGKISTEHFLSFPNIGEISVQAMKVKRRGSFYILSNSMVVKIAFKGIKGARFLHIDLVPATSIVKSQTGLTKVIMNESDVQPDKHNLLQIGDDANQLAVNGEDRHRDSIVDGLATENGQIRTSVSSVLERETLPGLDKRRDDEVPVMEELVIEGNAAIGSDLQQNGKHVADHENKDGMGEDHENASAGADMGVPVASKKEKSRKRYNALEIDQPPDVTSEHPYVEKKKRKKEKDGSLKELVKKTVMPDNNLQEKHDNNLASSEGFSNKPSHVDSSLQVPVNSKQNRKKKKHISKNDETPQNEMVDNLLNKTDVAAPGKQAAEEIHVDESVKNHTELGKESDVADLFEITQEVLADDKSEYPSVENKKNKEEMDGSSKDLVKDLPENCLQEKQENNLVSEGSLLQPPVDAKQKRKRKKHLSEYNEASQAELVDNLLNKTDEATQGRLAAGVNHDEELVNNHIELRKVSDAANLIEENTEKVLQTFLPENCFLEKHGTNLAYSDAIPCKLFDVDSSLRAPVDAKQKRKKKKHLLDKASDASLRKQPFEEYHVEEFVNNHAELGKESDAADLIKESTLKEQDGHSAKVRTTDPLSDNPNESTDTWKASTKFPAQDENFYKAYGNNQAQLSKVSDVVMTDADLAEKYTMESGILSEIGAKRSHRGKRKKKEKPELRNTQSNTHETVNSPRDQVPEEIQNKASSTHQEQLVGSTVISSPNEKKKKRSQKKSEKIELHNQESNMQSETQEEVNSSVDKIIGKVSKETSIKHLEAASLQEADENSAAVQSIVPFNPNDKKSKRSRKKSDKVELHSRDPIRAEPVHSLVDEDTKENPQVSYTQNKILGSDPGCPSKYSAVAAVDSTVPSNPSDKKLKLSRKKAGKAQLPDEECSKDEGAHPLEKEATKEKPGKTLTDISTGMDANSKSATIRREDAVLESLTELTSVITSTVNGRNSSRNYDLDHSLANEGTNENMEKISGTNNKSSGIELTANIIPDETGWSMDDAHVSNLVPTGYDDSFGNHETGRLSKEKENTIGLEKAGEGSMEIVHDRVHNTSAEAEDHRQPPKSDSANIDFIKISDPNLNQPEPEEVQGLPFVEIETCNSKKEKTEKKKKLNLSPQDSTINLLKPSVSELQVLKKKPVDSDYGGHSLVASEAHNAKELKSRKKREKRDASSIQKSDIHLHDTSSGLGTHVDDKIENKLKHHESDTHSQGSLMVDKNSKHTRVKYSMITGNKLQSLTYSEDTDIMVSATEISKQKSDDASVKSSTGGAAIDKSSSNAVDNIPLKEYVVGLAAPSDNAEGDTQIQKKRCRVAVRKVPSKRYKNVSNKFNAEKTLLASSATIFNDAASGSSEDKFEISYRRASVRANLDNSSTSADSYGVLDETQTAYKNSPGISKKIRVCEHGGQSSGSRADYDGDLTAIATNRRTISRSGHTAGGNTATSTTNVVVQATGDGEMRMYPLDVPPITWLSPEEQAAVANVGNRVANSSALRGRRVRGNVWIRGISDQVPYVVSEK